MMNYNWIGKDYHPTNLVYCSLHRAEGDDLRGLKCRPAWIGRPQWSAHEAILSFTANSGSSLQIVRSYHDGQAYSTWELLTGHVRVASTIPRLRSRPRVPFRHRFLRTNQIPIYLQAEISASVFQTCKMRIRPVLRSVKPQLSRVSTFWNQASWTTNWTGQHPMLSLPMRRYVRKPRQSRLFTRPVLRAFPLPTWPIPKNISKSAKKDSESDSKVMRWYGDMATALGNPGMRQPIDHN